PHRRRIRTVCSTRLVLMNVVLAALLVVLGFFMQAASADAPATSPATRPSEIRHGLEMSGSRESRAAAYYKFLFDRIEPSQHGQISRLPQYLDFFVREFVHDQRTFACALNTQSLTPDRAVIHGYFEFAESKAALNDVLKHLNLNGVEDQTELLPSAQLGDRRFGLVISPQAFVYDRPQGKRETLTECYRHDTIFVLKQAGDALLCHASSGYVGYID